MNSFSEFEMESMGGVVGFNFSPIENIVTIPEVINDCIGTPITFSGTFAFLTGIAIRDSLNFSEKQKIADAGESFSTVITGMIPKLTKEYLYLFNEMKRHRFVVLVIDNNGFLRLCGTKDAGMRFSFDQDSKNTPGQLNGFEFSFSLDHSLPSPFYGAQVTSLPVNWGSSIQWPNGIVGPAGPAGPQGQPGSDADITDILPLIYAGL